jgi:thiol:disulfide interchange protein
MMSMNNKEPFKPVWGLFAILVVVTVVALAVRAMRPDEIVPWREDFAAAQTEARTAGKPMLAYFTAAWCGPCQRMRSTTWADRDVEAALQDYVPVKIDIDRQPDLAMRYQVQAVPTMIVLRQDGEIDKVITGLLQPSDFISWLNRF